MATADNDNNTLPSRLHRRRLPSYITKTACRECRKSRAKCDGQQPCTRCVSKKRVACEYEVPVHIRKDEMRQEIRKLQTYRQQAEKIFESLTVSGQSDSIIHKLRQNVRIEDIYEQLTESSLITGSLDSVHLSQWWNESQSGGSGGSGGSDEEVQGRIGEASPGSDMDSMDGFMLGSRWTELSLSDTIIEQLLLLFFCWEYPIFSCVSKRHFAKDFNRGKGKNCSSLLVNAILAVGCRFSDQIEARADPDDSDTAGLHCYAEAERLLKECRKERSVTMVQAMSLMSTWNASRGDPRKARFYAGQSIRLAVEVGLHQQSSANEMSEDTHEVRNTAFWGAFMLDQAWSLTAGCLPLISRSGVSVKDPTAFDRDELREWIPYTGDQIPQGLDLRQPSNVRALYTSLCELSTIIHGTLYTVYADTDSLTSRDLLAQYAQILSWHSSLPEMLRLGRNSTPSVFFAHMYCHFSIIIIFYPFINTYFLDSQLSALQICTDAANAIVALAGSYKSLHGLRRAPCFFPYIVFAAGIVRLSASDPKHDHTALLSEPTQEIAILQLMSRHHGSSKRICEMLRTRALRSNSTTGYRDTKDPEEDAFPLWAPFVTMQGT